MHNAFFFLAFLSMFVTAGILFTGLFGLLQAGEFNKRYGNKLMRARVIAQGVTLLLFVAWYFS